MLKFLAIGLPAFIAGTNLLGQILIKLLISLIILPVVPPPFNVVVALMI